jgi:hypothetical protein
MSSVVISGDTSGSVTLSAPATAGSTVLTLPATSGTVVTTATSTGISGSAISTGTVGVSVGGTGANTLTANNVILGNGTSAVQFVAPGSTGNVLTSDGTTWTSAAAAGGQFQTQLFTTPGTWTKPASATQVKVTVIGGSGGGGANAGNPGQNGGLAGFAIAISPVSAPVAVTVGTGGISNPGGAGTSGGTSSFGALVSATGGGGGAYNTGGTGPAGTGTVSTGTALKTGSLTGTTFINNLQGSTSATGAREAKTYSTTSPYIAGAQAGQNVGGTSGAVVVEFVG